MIVNYKNAYEELKRLYERQEKENTRLKDKIDKAINLLEDNQFIWSAMDDEILKILKEN